MAFDYLIEDILLEILRRLQENGFIGGKFKRKLFALRNGRACHVK
jgi:hypothetical protein